MHHWAIVPPNPTQPNRMAARWRIPAAPSSLNRASLSWGWSGHIQGSCWSQGRKQSDNLKGWKLSCWSAVSAWVQVRGENQWTSSRGPNWESGVWGSGSGSGSGEVEVGYSSDLRKVQAIDYLPEELNVFHCPGGKEKLNTESERRRADWESLKCLYWTNLFQFPPCI